MPQAIPDASPGPARIWSDIARPAVGRFRIAAPFGLSVVHEPAESGHLSALLEDMARRLDRAVAQAGEGDADAWTAVSASLAGPFKVGVSLGQQVVHNARGATPSAPSSPTWPPRTTAPSSAPSPNRRRPTPTARQAEGNNHRGRARRRRTDAPPDLGRPRWRSCPSSRTSAPRC